MARSGRRGFQDAADGAQGPPDGGQVAHHFQEAHHGQLRGGGENPHPLGGHGLAADAEELRPGQNSRMAATSRAAWSSPEASPATTRMRGGLLEGRGRGADGPCPLPQTPSPNPHKFLVYLSHGVKSFSEITQ